jgi:hypothetical protein
MVDAGEGRVPSVDEIRRMEEAYRDWVRYGGLLDKFLREHLSEPEALEKMMGGLKLANHVMLMAIWSGVDTGALYFALKLLLLVLQTRVHYKDVGALSHFAEDVFKLILQMDLSRENKPP